MQQKNEKDPHDDRPKLLHSLIQHVLQEDKGSNPAFIYDDNDQIHESISYDQLFKAIKECSNEFQAHCKCNEYIGIDTSATNIETITAFLSLINIKAIVCPLHLCDEFEQSKKLIKTLDITSIFVNNISLKNHKIERWISTGKCSVSSFTNFKGISLCKRNSSENNLGFCALDNSIEFVVQSSGSTGPSKIIKVPGHCIYPNILDLCSEFAINRSDIIFLSSPLTFDASIVQIFISLMRHAALLITPDDIKKQPSKLCNVLFERNETTILQATPSLARQIGQHLLNSKKTFSDTTIRVLCLGAEPFPSIFTIKHMIGNIEAIDLYNIYGISEVSSWTSLQKIDLTRFKDNPTQSGIDSIMLDASDETIRSFSEQNVSIGDPLSGTVIELRSEDGRRINDGFGEIWIGGKDRVCLVDDEKTLKEDIMRFSGDIGLIKNSKMYYVVRTDNRVKIFGKFVDLETVEEIVEELSVVESAVCIEKQSKNDVIGDVYFVLFISCIGDIKDGEAKKEVIAELNLRLPAYCIPSEIKFVRNIPLTSHGKKDRNALRVMAESTNTNFKCNTDNSIKKSVLKIFENVLQNGLYSSVQSTNCKSFIENGGNSFMAVFVENELRNFLNSILNEKPKLPMLFDFILSKDIKSLLDYVYSEINQGVQSIGSLAFEESLKRNFYDIGDISSPVSFKKKIILDTEKLANEEISIKKSQQRSLLNAYGCYCSVSRGNRKTVCESCSRKALISNDQVEMREDLIIDCKLDVIWKTDTLKCIDASPLIVTSDDEELSVIYIGSHSYYFYAIEIESGKVIWNTKLGDRIESSAALSTDGEKIVVGCYDHMIYVINRYNGDVIWKFETGDCVKSSPIIHHGTGVVYIGSHDQYIHALDVDNSVELWRTHCGGGSCLSSPALAIDHNMVLIGTLAGNLVAIECGKGNVLWMFFTGKPIFSSPVTNNGIICFGCVDTFIYALNMEGKLLWKIKTKGPIFSSPLFIGSFLSNIESLIVTGSHDGFVYCVSSNGFLIWSLKTSSPVYSTSSLVEWMTCGNVDFKSKRILGHCSVVACSTDGEIFIIDVKSGKKMASLNLQKEIFSSPVLHGSKILIGCRDNNVYCVKISCSLLKI